MPNVIRCAVLGLGRQGYCHAVNIATHVRGAELVAVSDVLPSSAQRTAEQLGVKWWTTNPAEVIQSDEIDAIIVATPTNTHARLAVEVARAGKALFLEKPLSLDLDEAKMAMDAVSAAGIACQLGFMRRFDPAYAEARRRIAAGDIGQPLYIKAVSRDPQAPPASYIATSGGIFKDQSIHDYDIARFLLGDEVVEVTGLGSVLFTKEAEQHNDVDQALTYLRFACGASGDIEAYRNCFYGYDIRAEVLGTKGAIVVSGIQQHNVTILRDQRSSFDITPGFLERFKDAYLIEMQAFVDCLLEGEQPSVGVLDGLRALEIASAAQASREQKGPVAVHLLR